MLINLSQAWKHVNDHGGSIVTTACSSPTIDYNDPYLYTWLYDANHKELAEVSSDESYISRLANHDHTPFIEDGAYDLALARRNTLLQAHPPKRSSVDCEF